MITALILATSIVGYDWVGVSISTGKHSEEMSQRYFRSEEACRSSGALIGDTEDRVCFPVPSLPKEVWDRQDASDTADLQRNHEACLSRAGTSWTEAGRNEAAAECDRIRSGVKLNEIP
jgi:hypothetical protein